MVTAHSGALAGEHGAFEALFDAYGVHEMPDARRDGRHDGAVLVRPPGSRAASGIASVHDSGGERAMFVDLAADLGVPVRAGGRRDRSRRSRRRSTRAWSRRTRSTRGGPASTRDRIFRDAFAAFAADPEVGASVFCVDMTHAGGAVQRGVSPDRTRRASTGRTSRSACCRTSRARCRARRGRAMLRDAGCRCWRARRRVCERSGTCWTTPRCRARPRGGRRRTRWTTPCGTAGATRLATGEPLAELDGLALLADYGVPTVRRRGGDRAEARSRREAVGYPVALKTAAPGIAHKSDVDGVRLGSGRRGCGAGPTTTSPAARSTM